MSAPGYMVFLEFLNGPEAGSKVELGPGTHVLGRSPAADLTLTMSAVSSKHMEVTVGEDGTVRFKDLGSTNGTWSGGMKVTEGEWFAGSQLKLGNSMLKLLEASEVEMAAIAAADDLSPRAREQALSGRRGGGLKLLLLLVVVGAAGGAWWYFSQGGGEGTGRSRRGSGTQAAPTARTDMIEDNGAFESDRADAWTLDDTITIGGGSLTGRGPTGRAVLTTRFPLDGNSLKISATTDWAGVWPEVVWGGADEETVAGPWIGGPLGSGEMVLPLPAEAEWFRLSLITRGGGSLSNLRVESGDEAAEVRTHENRRYLAVGANLILLHRSGTPLIQARGVGGTWTPVAGGFDLAGATGADWSILSSGPVTLESGPTLIFSETGPVIAVPGARVEKSPGLLLGAEARRLWIAFEQSGAAAGLSGGVRLEGCGVLRLRWNLDVALTQATRLAREVERAAREGDTATLLGSTARLLSDWPFDEDDVDRALELRRNAILNGRRQFGLLEIAANEALFFESEEDVVGVKEGALALVGALPGTDVAREAEKLAEMLAGTEHRLASQARSESTQYRERVLKAIGRPYPFIATWLRERQE